MPGFTGEFSQFRAALSSVPMAGPSTGSYWWLAHLAGFLHAEPSLAVVTVHSYWLNKCLSTPSLPGYPTVPHLLMRLPPSRPALTLPRYSSLAHLHGLPIRIDEMNSVKCGGQHGVSDVFASALWALNALFQAMADGVDGVNIHTFPGTANQIFGFANVRGHWAAAVRPEYYGLLMFAQAAPPGSRALTVVQLNTGPIRAWATLGSDGRTRVVLINDSLTQSSSVLVRAPSPGGPAELRRLLASSAYATSGITLAGQSFGPAGGLSGPTSTLALPSSNAGTIASYLVPMPAASAAMLTIPPQPQAAAPH